MRCGMGRPRIVELRTRLDGVLIATVVAYPAAKVAVLAFDDHRHGEGWQGQSLEVRRQWERELF